jgi:broad specificity phosphatase PhoE
MILYFVRHGQTDFNISHRLQGVAIDEPLNEIGIKEMNDILSQLPKDFEVIYSSPLKRVFMSAEIISESSGKLIITNKEISERDFGSLAGKTWDEIPNGRELQAIDKQHKYDYRPYGGESVEDVEKRLNKFLEDVKTSGYNSALIVSSIGIIRLVYKILKGEHVTEVKNASVHTFEI